MDKLAVTTTEPPFSGILSAEVVNVTTGASSSLILISKEVLSPKATVGFSGRAKEINIFSIASSVLS